jgi:hypothetical protein
MRERETVFDRIGEEDQVIAFFPCIRFENQIMLSFRGQAYQMRKWTDVQKMEHDMKLLDELNHMYKLVNKLFIVCIRKKIKLIVENPYSEEHFLRRYWCLQPSVIDKDRRERGDYYKKPTQYWFVNRKPSYNFIFETANDNAIPSRGKDAWKERRKADYELTGAETVKVARSMIHPDYANRFIREFII